VTRKLSVSLLRFHAPRQWRSSCRSTVWWCTCSADTPLAPPGNTLLLLVHARRWKPLKVSDVGWVQAGLSFGTLQPVSDCVTETHQSTSAADAIQYCWGVTPVLVTNSRAAKRYQVCLDASSTKHYASGYSGHGSQHYHMFCGFVIGCLIQGAR
jgi:hypothetical protein